MTNIDEARARLELYVKTGRQSFGHSDDIALIMDALDAAEKGLYDVYVNLGEDTDGARNARELFGPMTRTTPGELMPKLAAEYRSEMEAELDAAERERDEALAVIERVREWWYSDRAPGVSYQHYDEMRMIFESAPADALRERDAEKWDEGAKWAAVECGAIETEDTLWLTPGDNPYRETKGEQ